MPSPSFKSGNVVLINVDSFMTIKRMGLKVDSASQQALLKVGVHLERKLKQRLSRPGGGRTYQTGKKGARYKFRKSSAPGQPPAVDTGRLRNSITHNVTGRPGNVLPNPGGRKGFIKAYVGTNVAYGYYLERGVKSRNILPRPWFYITVQSQMNRTRTILRTSLKNYIKQEARKRK